MVGTRSGGVREYWDRVVASDPGLTRLRMAVSAALGMSSTLAVEFGYAKATHASAKGILIAMLLGGIVAMMGSMALVGVSAWPKVRTAVFFPVAIGAGMLPGVVVAGHTDAMLTVFVAVMFLAVYVRRFGVSFFFYGFMIWLGYFFAAFLGATVSSLPALLGDVAIATAWTLLLSLTLLRTHPRRALGRVQRAFAARARAVARACADVLEADGDPRRRARAARRLHTRGLRLAEAALMAEAWSAEPGTLPAGWSDHALRRRLLDAQLAIDAMAHAATSLAEEGGELLLPAARVAGHLARREYPAVRYAAHALLKASIPAESSESFESSEWSEWSEPSAAPVPGHRAGQQLACGALDFVALAENSLTPPPTDEDGDFAPAASLALGVLPGSGAVAGQLPASGVWNRLGLTRLTTRQAVQVAVAGALAIALGRQVSETRYYWAVIASFIAFAGTATRSETTIKAANRVIGTLVGLGVGIGLADLTAGHTMWVLVVIVASMTCGFYLVNVSYACMIFFVTIMVAQLYSVLHEFTPGLLVLRLEETALGAAIGVGVALVVLPTGTRDTIRAARRDFLQALGELLLATAARLEDGISDEGDPAALTRSLEDRMRRLALVARPLTRPLVWGVDPKLVRHRLTLYAAVARHTRALATAPGRITDPAEAADLAASCRALAATLLDPADTGPDLPRQAGPQPAPPGPQTGAPTGARTTSPSPDGYPGPASAPGPTHPANDLYHLLFALACLSSDSTAHRAVPGTLIMP